MLSGYTTAQEQDDATAQFRRTVFTLQQEMLELKATVDRQAKELQAQKEELALQVERLNAANQSYKKQLLEMDSLLLQMEDKIAASSLIKLSDELHNLSSFQQAVLLDSMGQFDQSEKLILDIINQPDTKLSKDLLILFLAQQKNRHQRFEESISYYSTLLAEFFNSPFFSQAIFEMSDVLAVLGKKEQQLTLLAQLATLSETDPYSIKAVSKLKELGADYLFEDIQQDTSTDSNPTREKDQKPPANPPKNAITKPTPDLPAPVPVDSEPPVSSENTNMFTPAAVDTETDATTDGAPVIPQPLPPPAP